MNNLFVIPAAKEAKAMSPPAASKKWDVSASNHEEMFNRVLNKASRKTSLEGAFESHENDLRKMGMLKKTHEGNSEDGSNELLAQVLSPPEEKNVDPYQGIDLVKVAEMDLLLSQPVAIVAAPEQMIVAELIDSSTNDLGASSQDAEKVVSISEGAQKPISGTDTSVGKQETSNQPLVMDVSSKTEQNPQAVSPEMKASDTHSSEMKMGLRPDQSRQEAVLMASKELLLSNEEGTNTSQEQTKQQNLSQSGSKANQAGIELEASTQKVTEGKAAIADYKDIQVQKSVVSKTSHDPPPMSAVTSGAQHIEPARLAEAHQPQFVEQISKGIETLTRTGEGSIRLELHPENLGKIDLRLATSGDGVRITIKADLPVTSQLLERYLPELRQILVQAGVNVTDVTVGYGSPNHHAGNGNLPHFSGRPQSNNISSEIGEMPGELSENKIDPSLLKVDCRV